MTPAPPRLPRRRPRPPLLRPPRQNPLPLRLRRPLLRLRPLRLRPPLPRRLPAPASPGRAGTERCLEAVQFVMQGLVAQLFGPAQHQLGQEPGCGLVALQVLLVFAAADLVDNK